MNLHKEYVVFKNQYLLPELSPQEQAIELYELMQNNLYVNRQKLILDEQIESLFQISQAEEAVAQQERDNRLNFIILTLTVFTIFTALADFSNSVDVLLRSDVGTGINNLMSIFSIGNLTIMGFTNHHWIIGVLLIYISALFLAILITALIFFLFNKTRKMRNKEKK